MLNTNRSLISPEVSETLKDWELNSSVSDEEIRRVVISLGVPFPSDYLNFINQNNGGEGVIGDNYLIIWGIEEIGVFNKEYEVDKYAPGLILLGSSGGGEGYGFDTRDPAKSVVQVPFIGMALQYARPIADNFSNFLIHLAGRVVMERRKAERHSGRPLGMELFEITPVIVGGDPVDIRNKTWLTREQHFEAVQFWNRKICQLKEESEK